MAKPLDPEKRTLIEKLLREGEAVGDVAAKADVAKSTVHRVKVALRDAGEDVADHAPTGEDVDDTTDGVVVAREYLITLEALRDLALENARLRRALDAR